MEVGINQAAKITRKNKSVIWRDEKAGKLSATQNGKGQKVYNVAELERVYGKIYDPDAPETVETGRNGVASNQTQPDFETEKLALKLEFAARELALMKEQLDEVREDRDRWRTQAETALRALPAPVSATNSNQPATHKPTFWQRLTGAKA